MAVKGVANISSLQVVIIGLSLALMLVLDHVVHRTPVGMAMRAISWDKSYVPLMGISVNLIISITLFLGLIIGSAQASTMRRTIGASVAGAYLLGVLLNFAYLYPILSGEIIPYTSWLSHMWYHGWI